MKVIDVSLPSKWGCVVRGSLVMSMDRADLSEDMVEVELPNGDLICAGWNSHGYLVTMTRGLEHVRSPVMAPSVGRALATIREFAFSALGHEVVDPPYRVFAIGPMVSGDEAVWWIRHFSIDKFFANPGGGDHYVWTGCHQRCCTAESADLKVVDNPRNDPEGVTIIEAACNP